MTCSNDSGPDRRRGARAAAHHHQEHLRRSSPAGIGDCSSTKTASHTSDARSRRTTRACARFERTMNRRCRGRCAPRRAPRRELEQVLHRFIKHLANDNNSLQPAVAQRKLTTRQRIRDTTSTTERVPRPHRKTRANPSSRIGTRENNRPHETRALHHATAPAARRQQSNSSRSTRIGAGRTRLTEGRTSSHILSWGKPSTSRRSAPPGATPMRSGASSAADSIACSVHGAQLSRRFNALAAILSSMSRWIALQRHPRAAR